MSETTPIQALRVVYMHPSDQVGMVLDFNKDLRPGETVTSVISASVDPADEVILGTPEPNAVAYTTKNRKVLAVGTAVIVPITFDDDLETWADQHFVTVKVQCQMAGVNSQVLNRVGVVRVRDGKDVPNP